MIYMSTNEHAIICQNLAGIGPLPLHRSDSFQGVAHYVIFIRFTRFIGCIETRASSWNARTCTNRKHKYTLGNTSDQTRKSGSKQGSNWKVIIESPFNYSRLYHISSMIAYPAHIWMIKDTTREVVTFIQLYQLIFLASYGKLQVYHIVWFILYTYISQKSSIVGQHSGRIWYVTSYKQ